VSTAPPQAAPAVSAGWTLWHSITSSSECCSVIAAVVCVIK
jgi:hypothetical protein